MAEQLCSRAIKLDPNFFPAYYMRAVAKVEIGHRKWLDADCPKPATEHNGHQESAYQDLETAIALIEQKVEPWISSPLCLINTVLITSRFWKTNCILNLMEIHKALPND